MEILILMLIAVVGSVVVFSNLKNGEVVRFETTSRPQQVVMAAVGILASKRRWNTLSQSDSSANFTYQRGANKLLLVFLLLFFIVPGIVYWILSGKKEAVAVTAESTGPGMTVVQISSNGWRGKGAGRDLRNQIGLAPAAAASVPSTQTAGSLDMGPVEELEEASPVATPATNRGR